MWKAFKKFLPTSKKDDIIRRLMDSPITILVGLIIFIASLIMAGPRGILVIVIATILSVAVYTPIALLFLLVIKPKSKK